MSILFSKTCKYALQAILYLARKSNGQPVLLRDISGALNIPHHFLSKIMQMLAREGIIISHKGLNGGFALASGPDELRLIDIVRAVDGEALFDQCVLGFSRCSDSNPCPFHEVWKQSKQSILDMLYNKTLAELNTGLELKLASYQHERELGLIPN